MFKNFSPSLFFVMAALTVCIFTPFIMLLHPVFYSAFFTDQFSIYVPSPTYKRLILIGSLFVAGVLSILAYKRNKLIYVISPVLFIVGVGMWYFSLQNHISINEKHIVKQAFFSKDQYEWKEFKDIVYEYEEGDKGDYTFTLETGEQFIIKENELRSDARIYVYTAAVSNNIPFTERAK